MEGGRGEEEEEEAGRGGGPEGRRVAASFDAALHP